MDKIKKDTDTAKSNQPLMKAVWGLLIATFLLGLWSNSSHAYNGSTPVLQFIIAAAPWILMGQYWQLVQTGRKTEIYQVADFS